jgi:uncharacterized protein (DUF427 family)
VLPPTDQSEWVWDFPRPPRLESTARRIRVVFGGVTIADTTRALRVLETSHPPTYYVPPEDARMDLLEPTARRTFCEFKGAAHYLTLRVGDRTAPDCAWSYSDPTASFRPLKDHLAFYPGRVDACLVDEERAKPQPGGFYGGWVTTDLRGPFKGEPGTEGW